MHSNEFLPVFDLFQYSFIFSFNTPFFSLNFLGNLGQIRHMRELFVDSQNLQTQTHSICLYCRPKGISNLLQAFTIKYLVSGRRNYWGNRYSHEFLRFLKQIPSCGVRRSSNLTQTKQICLPFAPFCPHTNLEFSPKSWYIAQTRHCEFILRFFLHKFWLFWKFEGAAKEIWKELS